MKKMLFTMVIGVTAFATLPSVSSATGVSASLCPQEGNDPGPTPMIAGNLVPQEENIPVPGVAGNLCPQEAHEPGPSIVDILGIRIPASRH